LSPVHTDNRAGLVDAPLVAAVFSKRVDFGCCRFQNRIPFHLDKVFSWFLIFLFSGCCDKKRGVSLAGFGERVKSGFFSACQ